MSTHEHKLSGMALRSHRESHQLCRSSWDGRALWNLVDKDPRRRRLCLHRHDIVDINIQSLIPVHIFVAAVSGSEALPPPHSFPLWSIAHTSQSSVMKTSNLIKEEMNETFELGLIDAGIGGINDIEA